MKNTEIQIEQEEKILDAIARSLVLVAKELVNTGSINDQIKHSKRSIQWREVEQTKPL